MFVKKIHYDSNKSGFFSLCTKYTYYEDINLFRNVYLSFLVYTTRIGVILIWLVLLH
jgi:hypothetical protein